MNLDEQFKNETDKLGLDIIEILFKNEKKGRITALAKQNETKLILKWNLSCKSLHIAKLKKEISYYREHQGENHIVPLSYAAENILVIEYFKGVSLRKWLESYLDEQKTGTTDLVKQSFSNCVTSLLKSLKMMYKEPLDKKAEFNEMAYQLCKRFRQVCCFKPLNGAYQSKFETKFCRWIYRIFRSLARTKIHHIVKKINTNDLYIIHGDLHLNNILIGLESNEAKIIDFEDVEPGFVLLDIIYLYSLFYYLLTGLPNHQLILRECFSGFIADNFPELNNSFFELANIFQIGLSINRSVGYNISAFRLLKNLCFFPIKLLFTKSHCIHK
ncbi:MAG: phosphotransferase [Lachnospiraceae bacterium]|nr:phosphotransferase [Lachnospiraceae bacterium]